MERPARSSVSSIDLAFDTIRRMGHPLLLRVTHTLLVSCGAASPVFSDPMAGGSPSYQILRCSLRFLLIEMLEMGEVLRQLFQATATIPPMTKASPRAHKATAHE